MNSRFVIGWNIEGHELILQEWQSGLPRLFDTREEAEAIAAELEKDTGKCRILTVVQGSDPPENNSPVTA